MGRLIDTDKLKADLEKAISKNEGMDCLDFLRVASVIDAQPTAYNLEKVVAQLKEEKELSYANFDEYVNGVCPCLDPRDDDLFHRGLERAIEIVKAGGADAEH